MRANLGREKSLALPPSLPSFMGCDTTSAFFGRGKKTAREAWNCYHDVTCAFIYMAFHPYTEVEVGNQHFQLLEHFTVILYDKTSDRNRWMKLERSCFARRGRQRRDFPQHRMHYCSTKKLVACQAGMWCTTEQIEQHAPTPEGWGWTIDEDSNPWVRVWNMLPVVSKACSELVKCSCNIQSGCGARCACRKACWNCTELCSCHCEK